MYVHAICYVFIVHFEVFIYKLLLYSISNIYSFKLHNATKQKTIHWNGEGEETNIQLPLNGTAELWHSL